jgi:hypothetical protein
LDVYEGAQRINFATYLAKIIIEKNCVCASDKVRKIEDK